MASVDALRGFTMFRIIGADGAARALAEMLSGGGMIRSTAADFIAGQFEHVEWEGFDPIHRETSRAGARDLKGHRRK